MTRRRLVITLLLASTLGVGTTVDVAWVFACMSMMERGRTSAQQILPERGDVSWEPKGGPPNGINVDIYEQRGRVLVRGGAYGPEYQTFLGIVMFANVDAVHEPPDALVPQEVRELALPWLSGTPWPRGGDVDWREIQASGWPMISLACEYGRASDFSYRRRFAINIGGTRETGDLWRSRDLPRLLPLRPLFPGFLIDTVCFAAAWWVLIATPFWIRSRRRRAKGLCSRCGYDLRHTVAGQRCPECGSGPMPI